MKKTILILSIIALIIIILIGAGIIIEWGSPYYEVERGNNIIAEYGSVEDLLADLNGTIEGSLSYPSEFIPPLEVCAGNISTNEEFCTYEQIEGNEYDYGTGYRIEVLEGEYRVYAKVMEGLGTDLDDYKAYYSEFVTCGLDVSCTSHDPITVEVIAGETIKDIDPQDWYK